MRERFVTGHLINCDDLDAVTGVQLWPLGRVTVRAVPMAVNDRGEGLTVGRAAPGSMIKPRVTPRSLLARSSWCPIDVRFARYAGNLRGRVAVVPSRSQRQRPGAGFSFAFSILFSVVMNGHCCPCAHAGDKRIGGMPPRRQRRLAHRELSREVAVSGYSRPPPGYGFTGGTLRGEGEQAKSSSRPGD